MDAVNTLPEDPDLAQMRNVSAEAAGRQKPDAASTKFKQPYRFCTLRDADILRFRSRTLQSREEANAIRELIGK